jgi:hypothetical protein
MVQQFDMFGGEAPKGGTAEVEVSLEFHRDTDKAWLLSTTGRDRDSRWVPKSIAIRDEQSPKIFRMPRAEALSRGWL